MTNSTHTNDNNKNNLLKIISFTTVLSALIQITLGGIVRVTESGLGCPDWPLCFDQIVPSFTDTETATATETVIEYSHRVSGAILILEDVGEAPYRIDRMLTQWRLAGLLQGLAGLAFGDFTIFAPLNQAPSFSI